MSETVEPRGNEPIRNVDQLQAAAKRELARRRALEEVEQPLKVFVSWSGDRSLPLAEATRDWMEVVFHNVQPWLSQKDIDAGERWSPAIASELEATHFGILCLTRDNLSAPWLLFEAGALAKSVEKARVVPLLLDLEESDLSGPLSQFQAKKATSDGFASIAHSINGVLGASIPQIRLDHLHNLAWPDLAERIRAIPSEPQPTEPIRSEPQILEDLVSQMKRFDGRLDIVLDQMRSEAPKYRLDIPSLRIEKARFVLLLSAQSPGVLDPREHFVVSLAAGGASLRRISEEANISPRSVDRILDVAFRKVSAATDARRSDQLSESDSHQDEEETTNA